MGWYGFDFDGTLATYNGWRGTDHTGEPIKPIVDIAKKLLEEGKDVRVFTARASEGEHAILVIQRWTQKVFGRALPVTNKKDLGMIALFDDRCFTVETNTGRILSRNWDGVV